MTFNSTVDLVLTSAIGLQGHAMPSFKYTS